MITIQNEELSSTLIHIKVKALELMKQHGLDSKWSFVYDERKTRNGFCNYRSKQIGLSKFFAEHNPIEMIINTILHEIAHALTPGQHHNRIWKQKAMEIGCNGERCTNPIFQEPGKYVAVCKNGHVHYAYKKIRKIHSCGKCCKHYNEEFILEYKPVTE